VETEPEPKNGAVDAKTLDTSDSPILDEGSSVDTDVKVEDLVEPKAEESEPKTEEVKSAQEDDDEQVDNIVSKDDSKADNENNSQVNNEQETDNDQANDGEPQAVEDIDLSERESTIMEVPEVVDENDEALPTEETAKKKRTRKPKVEKE